MVKHAVDFDGTMAEYHGWVGPADLGAPIPAMIERIKIWLATGDEVVILTARACSRSGDEAEISKAAIRNWCMEHIGQELEVTAEKDLDIEDIWDDRAVRIDKNTGEISTQQDVEDPLNVPGSDSIGDFLASE